MTCCLPDRLRNLRGVRVTHAGRHDLVDDEFPVEPGNLGGFRSIAPPFDDVIRVDIESALQVIAAGNPAVKPKGEEIDRFMRVFEALTEAYDSVVLHADRDTVKKLTPALKFELPVTVVVLPQGTSASAKAADLGDFAALDCPVVVYEQTGKEGRSGLLGRVAAI